MMTAPTHPTTAHTPAGPAPHPMLALSPEAATAVREGAPLVALESTIISHGMPYPRNVEMALEVEGSSATPARSLPRSPSSTGCPGSGSPATSSRRWPATAASPR